MRNSERVTLVPTTVIGSAGTILTASPPSVVWAKYLAVEAVFLYGAGGTATKCYIQTSLDGGATWIDIMTLSFTTSAASKVSAVVLQTALAAAVTPGDGALTDNTILSGLIGDRIRAKVVTTGTYTGATSIAVYAVLKG